MTDPTDAMAFLDRWGVRGALVVAVLALSVVVVHLHRKLIALHERYTAFAVSMTSTTTKALQELGRRRDG